MTSTKSLIAVGGAAFAVFFAYLYATSPPATVPPPSAARITAPAPVEAATPAAATTEAPDDNGEMSLPDPGDVDFETALDDGGYFDDSSYPDDEAEDDLLVVEAGDPSRYVTAMDRERERTRQQRAKESSLNAAGYVGDDRLRAISTLGTYAAEGNADAIAELRNMLQSTDSELRADALQALGELVPGSNIVPAFAAEPPSDGDIDAIIAALQSQER